MLLTMVGWGVAAADFAQYQAGDFAQEDIVTPVPLVVIDPERTEALRQTEQRRVPAIFRFNPRAAEDVEAGLREAFTNARTAFVSAVNSTFGKPVLEVVELNTPQFRKVMLDFAKRESTFPLATELAQLWALGAAGEVIQTQWMEWLRSAMKYLLVDDALPAAPNASSFRARLIVSNSLNAAVDAATADHGSQAFARTNIVALSRAREAWRNFFNGAEAQVGEFLASFLRANCVLDIRLTSENRARAVQSIYAADRYEAGTILARRGQQIDAKIKRALDESRSRAMESPPPTAIGDPEPGDTIAHPPLSPRIRTEIEAISSEHSLRWFVVAGGGLALAVVGVLAFIFRRRRMSSKRLALMGEAELVPYDPMAASWQERALTAEAKVEKLSVIVRAGLIPSLAHWLSQHVVRNLVAERAQMVDAHQLAEWELSQLEERLTALQAPIAKRLQAYEHRIAQLEKELAAKDQENRGLIEAKIERTRKQLEAERGAEPSWN